MVKTMTLKCPNCGGTDVKFIRDMKIAKCELCNFEGYIDPNIPVLKAEEMVQFKAKINKELKKRIDKVVVEKDMYRTYTDFMRVAIRDKLKQIGE